MECECDKEGIYALAASNGKRHALLLSNPTNESVTIDISVTGDAIEDARFYVIDNKRLLSWAPNADVLEPCSVMLVEW